MSSRGGRNLLGRAVQGHELVHDTCKEGDDNAKRSPAGKAHPWGAIDSAQNQKQNTGPFQDHQTLPRGQPRKAVRE